MWHLDSASVCAMWQSMQIYFNRSIVTTYVSYIFVFSNFRKKNHQHGTNPTVLMLSTE